MPSAVNPSALSSRMVIILVPILLCPYPTPTLPLSIRSTATIISLHRHRVSPRRIPPPSLHPRLRPAAAHPRVPPSSSRPSSPPILRRRHRGHATPPRGRRRAARRPTRGCGSTYPDIPSRSRGYRLRSRPGARTLRCNLPRAASAPSSPIIPSTPCRFLGRVRHPIPIPPPSTPILRRRHKGHATPPRGRRRAARRPSRGCGPTYPDITSRSWGYPLRFRGSARPLRRDLSRAASVSPLVAVPSSFGRSSVCSPRSIPINTSSCKGLDV